MNDNGALSADRVRADVAGVLGRDPADIGTEDNLLDLGLDSIRVMSLIERWREAGASGLDFPAFAERPELGHWINLVTGEVRA